MIRDARVLQAQFVPDELQHRNAEINTLSNTLSPIMDGRSGDPSLLLGPSGAGKTCIAQFTVGRLQENARTVTTQYINCWQDYARFQVLYRILESVGTTADIHRRSTPTDELLDRLRRYDGPPLVVILDEVDQLEDDRVLYDLYQISRITMILITNRERDLFTQLDDRLTSRLHTSVRVSFERYGLDELVSILRARVRWGLVDDALGSSELESIADAAAGDARIAIGILRHAARLAEQADAQRITPAVVGTAIPEGRQDVRQKTIEQLTAHQHVLYDILQDRGELDPATLYETYRDRVDEPKTNRTVRNYLTKMEHYRLIHAEGDNRARTYRPR